MAILTAAITVPVSIQKQDLSAEIIKLQVCANNGSTKLYIDDGDLVSEFMAAVAVFAAVPVTGVPTFAAPPDWQDLEALIIKTIAAVNTHNGH